MTIQQVTKWHCKAGKAIAVNPFIKDSKWNSERINHKEFEMFKNNPTNQPSCPKHLSGDYSASMFGKPVEQGFSPSVGWVTKEAVNNVVVWTVMAKRLYLPLKEVVAEKEVYTYFRIDFNNFCYNDGDYDIFNSISDMLPLLKELEAELDTPNDEEKPEKSIIITGVVMTKKQFEDFKSRAI